MATYEMKPRLNRLNGVSTVVVQGGQEPEFEIRTGSGEDGAGRGHRAGDHRCGAAQQHDRLARA